MDLQDYWLTGPDSMLRDERSLPLEFDSCPFFNKDSGKPPLSSWITANEHPIFEPVRFPRNSVPFFFGRFSGFLLVVRTVRGRQLPGSISPAGLGGSAWQWSTES